MIRFPLEPGRVVRSKAGRDLGRHMVVMRVEDGAYAYVADGDLRKLSSPKRKKIMHLHATPVLLSDIALRLEANKPVQDAEIRKALDLAGYGNCQREKNKEGEAFG